MKCFATTKLCRVDKMQQNSFRSFLRPPPPQHTHTQRNSRASNIHIFKNEMHYADKDNVRKSNLEINDLSTVKRVDYHLQLIFVSGEKLMG